MSKVISFPEPLAPVRKSVVVPLTPERAFRLFTEGLSTWWPLASHSISDDRAASCGLEPRVGGAVYEVRDDGERFVWGSIEVWEPPTRFVMRWHPGRDAASGQQVEVRFSAAPEGTRVDLEHRDWERLAERAEAARTSYDGGWDQVLARCFADACSALAAEHAHSASGEER